MNEIGSARRSKNSIILTAVLLGVAVGVTMCEQNNSEEHHGAPDGNGKCGGIEGDPPTKLSEPQALHFLADLCIKGRAPMTGYSRERFGDGWESKHGCDTRDLILQRDLTQEVMKDACEVQSGTLHDPYTGKLIHFTRGVGTSTAVQIDHVVALGDAWQTGAQGWTTAKREQLANDPLELLAVDGPTNEAKGDSDAASWLPANKSSRCEYVARQILVKDEYDLWVTPPEHDALQRVLQTCPTAELSIPQ